MTAYSNMAQFHPGGDPCKGFSMIYLCCHDKPYNNHASGLEMNSKGISFFESTLAAFFLVPAVGQTKSYFYMCKENIFTNSLLVIKSYNVVHVIASIPYT